MGTLLKIAEVLNQPLSFFLGDSYDQKPGPTAEEVMASKVAERVMEILKSQNGQVDVPAAWVDDFLSQINRQQMVRESAAAYLAASPARDEKREIIGKLNPEELDPLVDVLTRDLLSRFVEFVNERRRQV